MKSYTNSWGRKVQLEAEPDKPGTFTNAFGRTVPIDPTVREESAVHVNAYGRPVPDGYASLAPAEPARKGRRGRVEAGEANTGRAAPPPAGGRQEAHPASPKRRKFEIEESG
ncbi:MAG: hypothetical protein KDB60_13905, partial [Propionibacteriaceae bacterium]|nr:hypothetical protein [Propionibacteriaceae bacterium]